MDDLHPLWHYLPLERQHLRARLALRSRRLLSRLRGRRVRVVLVTTFYTLVWCLPLLLGQPLITFFALLPLLLVPPVGLLVYWLVWREFHG